MNTNIKKLIGFMMLCALVAVPIFSSAAEFRAGEKPSITRNEEIRNDVYMAGGSVSTSGVIRGDLIAGGGNIVISGIVDGDIIAGGGDVNIHADVGDDARVAGGNVVVSGSIGGDLIVGGGQVNISGPVVKGDVVIGGGEVLIEAPIEGSLMVGAGSVFINGPVSGDVMIEADVVKLGSSAIISGNITYSAKKEMDISPDAVVIGKVTFTPRTHKSLSPAVFASIFTAFLAWKFFSLLAGALLVGLIFRRFSKEIVNMAEKRPLHTVGRGVVTLAVMIVVPILLMMTVIGIPLAILGLASFVALMILSCIVTPIIVGSLVHGYFSKKDPEVSWKTIVLGVIVYLFIGILPFIGWLLQSLLMFLSLGSVATLKWRTLRQWR